MEDLNLSRDFHGPNAGYIEELYERYLENPDSVDETARAAFAHWSPTRTAARPASDSAAAPCEVDALKVVLAARVTRLVREKGHLTAHIDPLGSAPPGDPELELAFHGLTEEDLVRLPATVVGGPLAEGAANALEAVGRLRRAYSRSIGYENDHIQVPEERNWLRDSIESFRFFRRFEPAQRVELLERLTEVETFERYLHKTFLGQKRFSLEGGDMLVPMIDTVIRCQAARGTREVVIGMAHRGRLNVLAHILRKPYDAILAEFQAAKQEEGASVSGAGTRGWTGDVKYHLGARIAYTDSHVNEMPVTLAPNPSHLEFVNPVVVGRARAAQERRNQPGRPLQDSKASLAILIHGDAAFPGQGIVAETLNLSQLPGYSVGGTIHIIVNNQIGFTTGPGEARSTLYASDLAKGFEIPIVHVNADDPAACISVALMACAYRERFHKDFLIDLVGYRRYGHNEGDAPEYTQPRMYRTIAHHPTVREIWQRHLEEEGLVTAEQAQAMIARVTERLQRARAEATRTAALPEPEVPPPAAETSIPTAVSQDELRALNEALLDRPEGYTPNPKLESILARRRAGLEAEGGIDWAHAESLAFASILADGTPIRFTGQDTERGTFGQRHLALHDPLTGAEYVPLQNLTAARASFDVHNSPLSENAAMGFEYGYSIHATRCLVLWEAQFGDFANSAQVIIDQFLVSGSAKWGQTPSLALLLPHGYEGQGPEHSSARLERFLQLCANDNLRVVNPTTAAQYFHVLRRQAGTLITAPKPLVLMTPKWLLRHPLAGSSLRELSDGGFQPLLDDPHTAGREERVTRVVLCSGKVWAELASSKAFESADHVAAIRIEQLYPFPSAALKAVLARYPAMREVVWLQEEPRNMGAWSFVAPHIRELVERGMLRFAGRPESSSPAEGSLRRHTAEQGRILAEALRGHPRPARNSPRATAQTPNT